MCHEHIYNTYFIPNHILIKNNIELYFIIKYLFGITSIYITLKCVGFFMITAIYCHIEYCWTCIAYTNVFPTFFAMYVNATNSIASILFASYSFGFATNKTFATCTRTSHQPTKCRRVFQPQQQKQIQIFLKIDNMSINITISRTFWTFNLFSLANLYTFCFMYRKKAVRLRNVSL